ncbi:MAG: GAF and ANTAR domain-containing protein [Jatrophihabitantaceae bacterium]
MLDKTELTTAGQIAALARQLCELRTEADARQFLARQAVTVAGCAAAAFGRRTAGGALEFSWSGPAELVDRLTTVLAQAEEAIGAAALAQREPVSSPDLAQERRWPEYASVLLSQTPVRSAQAYPVRLADCDLGVLILYSTDAGFFAAEHCQLGAALADHAAIGLSLLASRYQAEHLTNALANSREIGQAMGIIMATHKVTSEKAFDLLRTASQHGHVKLRDVAHEVILTGELPAPAVPPAG